MNRSAPVERFSVAVIVDRQSVKQWQRDCLEHCRDLMDVAVVYSCRSATPGKRSLKHSLYYVLNILALRNRMTQQVGIGGLAGEVVEFDADSAGAWQSLPASVIEDAKARKVDFIVKFGMGLLRIPPELAEMGVLSFHHGDPEVYRGRPAGFYEVLHRAPKQGVVVQLLSNRLDAGTFLARAWFRIDHHSYRKTAERFYRGSRHVFRKAVVALRDGRTVPVDRFGPNYRLPSNGTVAAFGMRLGYRKLARILRGLFVENAWKIGLQPCEDGASAPRLSLARARIFETPRGYTFLADPFFAADGRILAEGLSARSHVGDIVAIEPSAPDRPEIVLTGGHYSYPSAVAIGGRAYLLPENAAHAPPAFYPLAGGERRPVRGLEGERLIDPTHFEHDGRHYLFAGLADDAADTLHLFHGPSIDGPYARHPRSPIVLDPECARMGGNLLTLGGELYRLGQDNRYGYGNGLRARRVLSLSPEDYEEEPGFQVDLSEANGPHTLNIGRSGLLFDFYHRRISLLAGYRRIRARLA